MVSRNWKHVKESLLFSLTNRGKPLIYVVNGNYENKGELFLRHMYEGRDLQIPKAKDTIENLYEIWKRPIRLETVDEKGTKELVVNGEKHFDSKLK